MAGGARAEQKEEGDSGAELTGDAGLGAGAAKVSTVGYKSPCRLTGYMHELAHYACSS